MLYLRDIHGLSFRISPMVPELQSKAATLNSLVLQRWQLNKLVNQVTNRLHQIMLAVFPEGEAQCFNSLLKVASFYPTPEDILESNSLEDIKGLGIYSSVTQPGNSFARNKRGKESSRHGRKGAISGMSRLYHA